MAIYNQLPGRLDIKVSTMDDLTINLNIDQSITGYTFAAFVADTTTNTFTVTALSSSSLRLTMASSQLDLYGTGDQDWKLVWTTTGGDTRTILNGKLVVL